MNWHTRYAQQANWTRSLRSYVFDQVDLSRMRRVLEVGCGTGAILAELPQGPQAHGLDVDAQALAECQRHAPAAQLTRGNALQLPNREKAFDLVYSHFLLLWVSDPLQALLEMKRVTQPEGYVIAFAEPDYPHRVDQPEGLMRLGQWQTESLRRQGADPGLGLQLADLFFQAGIKIIETGTLRSQDHPLTTEEWDSEWRVIEADLDRSVAQADLQEMKNLDRMAREQGKRILQVPTYFAWGRV